MSGLPLSCSEISLSIKSELNSVIEPTARMKVKLFSIFIRESNAEDSSTKDKFAKDNIAQTLRRSLFDAMVAKFTR